MIDKDTKLIDLQRLGVFKTACDGLYATKDSLATKANASSLGVTNQRVSVLEEQSATKTELAAALSDIDIIDKTTRQLAVMYFLPPYQEGKVYQKDMIIRMDGRVFKSLTDGNTACPYTVLTDEGGTIIVNDNWEALILDDVNEQNWAQLDETLIPTSSIPDRMTSVETRMETFEGQATATLSQMQSTVTNYVIQKKTEVQAQATAINAQIDSHFSQTTAAIDQTLASYRTAIAEAQALIQRQADTIDKLQQRIAWMDNLTIMVSDNRNDSDSYTDNN